MLLLRGALLFLVFSVFLREERVAAPPELVERARGRGREAADLEGGDHRFPRLSVPRRRRLVALGVCGGLARPRRPFYRGLLYPGFSGPGALRTWPEVRLLERVGTRD